MARPATGVASHGRDVSRRAIGREVQELGRRAASRPRAPLESRRHQPQGRLGSAPVQTTALGARPVANRPAPTASESHGPSPGARAQQPQTRQWPIAAIPAPAPAPPLHHRRSRTPRPAGVSRRRPGRSWQRRCTVSCPCARLHRCRGGTGRAPTAARQIAVVPFPAAGPCPRVGCSVAFPIPGIARAQIRTTQVVLTAPHPRETCSARRPVRPADRFLRRLRATRDAAAS